MEDLNAALALDPHNALALRFRGAANNSLKLHSVRVEQCVRNLMFISTFPKAD